MSSLSNHVFSAIKIKFSIAKHCRPGVLNFECVSVIIIIEYNTTYSISFNAFCVHYVNVLFQVRAGAILLSPEASNSAQTPPPMCSNCDIAEATIDCPDCESIFCQTCSKSVHCLKMNARHQPVAFSAVNGGVRPSVRCPEHGEPWKYFCMPCKRLVCVSCCIVGYVIH